MPRVGYAIEQQGFRPRTNPIGALAGLGLLGLGDGNIFGGCVTAVDAQGNPVSCSDPSAAVWFDANMNAVAPGTPSAAPTPPPSVPSGAPTGAALTYVAQWPITLIQSADSILGKVKASVQSFGLQVISTNYQIGLVQTAPFAVQIQMLVTGSGFARPQDAGSIVDHAFYSATGKMPASSQTVVASLPGAPSSVPGAATCDPGINPNCAAQPSTFTQWLEQNALWIGIAVIAVAVGPNLVKKIL